MNNQTGYSWVKQKNKWESGLCDCCQHGACGTCCLSCFCPWVQFGINFRDLKDNNGTHSVLDLCCPASNSGCFLSGAAYFMIDALASGSYYLSSLVGIPCLSWFACIHWFNIGLHYELRENVQKLSQIQGDVCCDIMAILFCYSCAMTQEHIELEKIKAATRGNMAINSMSNNSMLPSRLSFGDISTGPEPRSPLLSSPSSSSMSNSSGFLRAPQSPRRPYSSIR